MVIGEFLKTLTFCQIMHRKMAELSRRKQDWGKQLMTYEILTGILKKQVTNEIPLELKGLLTFAVKEYYKNWGFIF